MSEFLKKEFKVLMIDTLYLYSTCVHFAETSVTYVNHPIMIQSLTWCFILSVLESSSH